MKGRESGMPQKEMWEGFFNPSDILSVMGISGEISDVAEFGCGYGTFTIPAANTIRGILYAIDIEDEMIALTRQEAEKHHLRNVKTIRRDFIAQGTGLKDESIDYVMLFNILHIEQPAVLLKESYRILKPDGKLGIIHWNYDPSTPRGPSMDIRPKSEQCIQWAEKEGFIETEQYDLKPYHYGIVLKKNLRSEDYVKGRNDSLPAD
jgi:ubiquinone/menaquinone biosynthesis C-methylase UbiE